MGKMIELDAVVEVLNQLARENFSLADSFQIYLDALKDVETKVKALPSAQPEYERVSAEDVAVNIAHTKLASAVWLYGTLTELEKAGYVICRRMT